MTNYDKDKKNKAVGGRGKQRPASDKKKKAVQVAKVPVK